MTALNKQDTSELRRNIKQQRITIPVDQQMEAALAITEQLVRQRHYRSSQHIALYLPNRGEIDTRYLIEDAWLDKKSVYLPGLMPVLKNR